MHTLANYMRQTGALVTTLRSGCNGFESEVARLDPTLLVLSPGPGCPKDFGLHGTIDLALRRRLPIFGVCLGLQGIAEYFGGSLDCLSYPQHGKPAQVALVEPRGDLFEGMPACFQVGIAFLIWQVGAVPLTPLLRGLLSYRLPNLAGRAVPLTSLLRGLSAGMPTHYRGYFRRGCDGSAARDAACRCGERATFLIRQVPRVSKSSNPRAMRNPQRSHSSGAVPPGVDPHAAHAGDADAHECCEPASLQVTRAGRGGAGAGPGGRRRTHACVRGW